MRAASGWNQAGNGAQPVGWTADPDFPAHAGPRAPLVQIRNAVRLNRPEILFYLRPRSGLLSNRDGPDPGCYWDGNSAWLAEERTTQVRFSSSGAACAGCLLLWAVPTATHWQEQKQSGPGSSERCTGRCVQGQGPPGVLLVGLLPPGPCFLESPVKSTLPHTSIPTSYYTPQSPSTHRKGAPK